MGGQDEAWEVGVKQANGKGYLVAVLVTVPLSIIRVPKRPVINTPVVSISVHDDEELLPRALDKPVTVQFRLLETEERTKPICVFWNHSIL